MYVYARLYNTCLKFIISKEDIQNYALWNQIGFTVKSPKHGYTVFRK